MSVAKEDVIGSCSKVQMFSGQAAESEAAIHSMWEIFESEESKAIFLVEAANASTTKTQSTFTQH